MVSVTSASRYITSASRYYPRYQCRSSMYIRGLIPLNFAELAEAVPMVMKGCIFFYDLVLTEYRVFRIVVFFINSHGQMQ